MVCVVPLRPEVPSWSRSVDGGVRLRLPSIEAFDVGSGTPCVPVYDPDIFIALQKAGANMAVLSMPGPFQASLPYEADPDAVRLLDYLVGAAAIAGLFIVIAFRTSPGRNDKDLLNLLPGPLERTLPLIRIGKRLRDASSISRSMPAQHVA